MKDEGLKYVCQYMEKGKSVKQLKISSNDITPLGNLEKIFFCSN